MPTSVYIEMENFMKFSQRETFITKSFKLDDVFFSIKFVKSGYFYTDISTYVSEKV